MFALIAESTGLCGSRSYPTAIGTEQQDMGLEFHLLPMQVSELAAN